MKPLALALLLVTAASPASSSKVKSPKLPALPEPLGSALARAKDPHAIRAVPVTSLFATEAGFASTGEVAYADLTGDGKDELIVPLSSGGSAGDVAVAVYGFDAHGALTRLLWREGQHLRVAVKDGALQLTEPVYGPNDPNCCPSAHQVTVLKWDGKAFAQLSQATAPGAP